MESSEDLTQEFWVSAKRYLAHQISLIQKANHTLKPGIYYEKQKESSYVYSDSRDEISVFLEMLDEELPNFLLAFEWARQLEEGTEICKLADELSTFLNLRSHWSEWLRIAEFAVKEAESVSDLRLESVAYNNLAVVYRQIERFKDAVEYSQKSLSFCQEISDRYGEGLAYGNLAGSHFALREMQVSQIEYEKARNIFLELDNLYEQSQSLMGIGMVLARSHKLEEAVSQFEACLEIQRKIGDKFGEAQTLNNLGIALRMQGKLDQAIQSLRTSIQIKKEIGDRQGNATALNNLAIAHLQQGELDLAIAALSEALSMSSELNPSEMERITERLAKVQEMKRTVTTGS